MANRFQTGEGGNLIKMVRAMKSGEEDGVGLGGGIVPHLLKGGSVFPQALPCLEEVLLKRTANSKVKETCFGWFLKKGVLHLVNLEPTLSYLFSRASGG